VCVVRVCCQFFPIAPNEGRTCNFFSVCDTDLKVRLLRSVYASSHPSLEVAEIQIATDKHRHRVLEKTWKYYGMDFRAVRRNIYLGLEQITRDANCRVGLDDVELFSAIYQERRFIACGEFIR